MYSAAWQLQHFDDDDDDDVQLNVLRHRADILGTNIKTLQINDQWKTLQHFPYLAPAFYRLQLSGVISRKKY